MIGRRLRFNLRQGELGGSIGAAATTITFTVDPGFPTLGAGEYLALTLDDTEIVHLTAFTSGATTGTIERGQEGTTAVAHDFGVPWKHALTAQDLLVGVQDILTVEADDTFEVANYPYARRLRVRGIGGGASGGGSDGASTTTMDCGGGGSSGVMVETWIDVRDLAASEVLTIGQPGAASQANGNDGTTTSFGAHLVAPGGKGGATVTNASDSNQVVVTGGVADVTGAVGDWIYGGGPGGPGITQKLTTNVLSLEGQGGAGGSTPLGAGGGPVWANQSGLPGQGYGSGGGGGCAHDATARPSGAGATGVLIVEVHG